MNPEVNKKVEDWFGRRRLTLDLAGLSSERRSDASIFLGGSAAEFVGPSDKFEYSDIALVVFKWGDPVMLDIMPQMLEHNDNPQEDFLFPFSLSTVIDRRLWALAVQDRRFMPALAYASDDYYIEMPYDTERGREQLQDYELSIPTHKQLIGQVGPRWVLFEMGMDV